MDHTLVSRRLNSAIGARAAQGRPHRGAAVSPQNVGYGHGTADFLPFSHVWKYYWQIPFPRLTRLKAIRGSQATLSAPSGTGRPGRAPAALPPALARGQGRAMWAPLPLGPVAAGASVLLEPQPLWPPRSSRSRQRPRLSARPQAAQAQDHTRPRPGPGAVPIPWSAPRKQAPGLSPRPSFREAPLRRRGD